jgi:SAM-dependent methyltransferase
MSSPDHSRERPYAGARSDNGGETLVSSPERSLLLPTPGGMREIEWTGAAGPFRLLLSPTVFAPTSTSRLVAEAMEIPPGATVLDVGCGSGVLSFVAARKGAGRVVGCDAAPEAVADSLRNAERLGLSDRVEFRLGNLLEPVRDVQAQVVIGDVSGIPDRLAAASDWFPGGYAGGPTGSELPVAMVETLGECLDRKGVMYLPTGTIQAENRVLAAARRVFGQNNMDEIVTRELPLPSILAKSQALAQLVAEGLVNLRRRGSRLLWRITVWRCRKT